MVNKYDPDVHHRRSIRLKRYDYSQSGVYFVTLCVANHSLYFDDPAIKDFAEKCWVEIPHHFPSVILDQWIVMPNHLHGIVICRGVQLNALTSNALINANIELNGPPTNTTNASNHIIYSKISPRRNTISVIIRTYKAAVTTLCRRNGYNYFRWQRNYYEHIIRDENELNLIRQYITTNPKQWDIDSENPNAPIEKVQRYPW